MNKKLTHRQIAEECEEVSVNGIPCLAHISTYEYYPPNLSADNPYDFQGHYNIEYQIYDRKGYRAGWLENIIDSKNLDQNIIEQITDKRECSI